MKPRHWLVYLIHRHVCRAGSFCSTAREVKPRRVSLRPLGSQTRPPRAPSTMLMPHRRKDARTSWCWQLESGLISWDKKVDTFERWDVPLGEGDSHPRLCQAGGLGTQGSHQHCPYWWTFRDTAVKLASAIGSATTPF